MAERGVYSEAEKRMLEAEAVRFATMTGWYQAKRPLVATAQSLRRLGLGVDPWNPLWHDESYARTTRWQKILAYPTYLGFFGETGIMSLRAPAECGLQYMVWMGEDYEFEHPVLAEDRFSVYQHRPQIFDVTPAGADSPRTFGLVEGDLEYFDENEQPLGRLRNYVQRTFQWEPPPVHPMPMYSYTKEELLYLGDLMRAEKIRGAQPRFWDDVRPGDELDPIVTGPTTMATNSLVAAITPDLGDFFAHTRAFFLDSLGEELGPEFIPDPTDPASGRYLVRGGPMGRHYSDLAAQAEGEPCAWLFGVVSRFSLLRVITNWMGDGGLLRRFSWRHMTRTPVGDALIGQGRVLGKRREGPEHLVDLHVWLRNMRGNVSETAVATVRLPARDLASAETSPAAPAPHHRKIEAPAQQAPSTRGSLSPGERVRVRAKPDWPTPPGFRFAGAEGTVVKWVHYDEPMAAFSGLVTCVRIEQTPTAAQPYLGSPLVFLTEDLDRL